MRRRMRAPVSVRSRSVSTATPPLGGVAVGTMMMPGPQAKVPPRGAALSWSGSTRPDPFLVMAGVSTLVWIWVWHMIWRPVAQTRPTVITLVILLALWLLDQDRRRSLRALPRVQVYCLTGLLMLAALSVPFSVYARVSLDYLLVDYSLTFLWMLMLASAVRTFADLRWLLGASLIGACGFALSAWIFDKRGTLSAVGYYDSNDFAAMLVCILPVAVHFLKGKTTPVMRGIAAAASAFFVLAVMRSESRGGFLGIVVVGLTILFLSRAVSRRARLTAVVLGGLALALGGSQEYWDRIRTVLHPSEDYNFSGKNTAGRIEIWKRGVGYMISSPVGVGIAAFPHAEGRSSTSASRVAEGRGFKWSASHNSFVQVSAELGIGGAVLLLTLFVSVFRFLIPLARRKPSGDPRRDEEAALAGTLLACFAAFTFVGSFLSFGYSTILYFLIGVIVAFMKVVRGAGVSLPSAGQPTRRSLSVRS
jgi:O-antigen ligase